MTPDILAAIPFLEFAEDKLMPVTGGLLDQSDSFLHAYSLWRSIRAPKP